MAQRLPPLRSCAGIRQFDGYDAVQADGTDRPGIESNVSSRPLRFLLGRQWHSFARSSKTVFMNERVTTPSIWSEARRPRTGPEAANDSKAVPTEGDLDSQQRRSVFQQDI